jgi:hypothetical protein
MSSFWSKSKTSKPVSDKFFSGANLVSRAIRSNFGKAKTVVEGIFGNVEFNTYQMPKVIIIGDESTGKSSLLENIIKCPILPRDSKICTKCPIYIKLGESKTKSYSVEWKGIKEEISKKSIANKIQKCMDSIEEGVISSDEIIVNINEPGLATFEYYDLPGIRTYPAKISKQSEELCEKYLRLDNCIVLCVVPGTQPRITASRSLGLVQKHNKCKDTIIALTMIDRINNNVEELLINRLLRTSDEFNELGVYGCIGVINREHTNSQKIIDSNNLEKKWISDHFDKNGMPDMYKVKSVHDKIIDNLGTDSLINQLDALYNKYIHDNWKPKIITALELKIKTIEQESREIGDDLPKEIIFMAVLADLTSGYGKVDRTGMVYMCEQFKVDFPEIIAGNSAGNSKTMQKMRKMVINEEFMNFIKTLPSKIKFVPHPTSYIGGMHINLERYEELIGTVSTVLRNLGSSLVSDLVDKCEREKFNEPVYSKMNARMSSAELLIHCRNSINGELHTAELLTHFNNTINGELHKNFRFQYAITNLPNLDKLLRKKCVGYKLYLECMCQMNNGYKYDFTGFINKLYRRSKIDFTGCFNPMIEFIDKYANIPDDCNLYKLLERDDLFIESDKTRTVRSECQTRLQNVKDNLSVITKFL